MIDGKSDLKISFKMLNFPFNDSKLGTFLLHIKAKAIFLFFKSSWETYCQNTADISINNVCANHLCL